ncbi:hypothetical protein SERLA73DRAFT_169686 [Serpula lacrymans var. lacrymans S7.3]|uniref:Urea carboxylase n=2 Tax=Serpula lacrymans var. lacrymans TaxID=341189 RepID=F8Q296_SERL3|nr:uncharacterized protein SERLADRAFT_450619 [Serpula lacrymans var. lacrymans S7.9]EGN97307.1 hypothetical protein SERLA73DRAFT_169686 [Serpula lacrymans var. lacrymans S7.3]EGO22895.1 hypothetical protein SERLADRAFT_450619 [Serpula lacrymans var. lacrymans S7.9]
MYSNHKLLIANRGEIGVRIIHTARQLGIVTLAIYTSSDALSPHVSLADESVMLQSSPEGDSGVAPSESKAYLSVTHILSICKQYNVTLVHPGYGFLSENAEFSRLVIEAGITWLGPQPHIIEMMGLKHEARAIAAQAGLQLVPGSQGLLSLSNDALVMAKEVRFPVMLKATAGGGGMGLVICYNEEELVERFTATKERAQTLFHHNGVFIERYFPAARHIEVQIFGNGLGDVVHMGERECSVQRRHQKVIEETPSPFFSHHPGLRNDICQAAVQLCKMIKYASAGTVEFLVDDNTGSFYFLEMNTRIQVEHPITEAIHPGLDIVKLMIVQGIAQFENIDGGLDFHAAGVSQDVYDRNIAAGQTHAIEARVYCENPADSFRPCPGILQFVDLEVKGSDEWLRIDHWISSGTSITPFFDPLLCKLIVVGSTREEAITRLIKTLEECKIHGPPNNIHYLKAICESSTFTLGKATTKFLDTFPFIPKAMAVISGGVETTIQDLPGRRIGFGIPRSGPMDSQAFSTANLLVGNMPETEALEIVTLPGADFRLRFLVSAVVAVTGKSVPVKIDGKEVEMWTRLVVPADGRLVIGSNQTSAGLRVYLAIRGGFPEVPEYLGSKSTSMGTGGYQGRKLVSGDQLALGDCEPTEEEATQSASQRVLHTLIPLYHKDWTVYVLAGPQDDEEYLLNKGSQTFYSTSWRISSSSNRMGIRLESKERFEWARSSGGEGGSHPSNILDNGYALGSVNVNGDTPVILTQEGPDMGGYVCVCTVASAEMWKLGQLSPGNTVKFQRITYDDSVLCRENLVQWFEAIKSTLVDPSVSPTWTPVEFEDKPLQSILHAVPESEDKARPGIVIRQAGDSAVLVEYGDSRLDFHMRARVHALETEVGKRGVKGVWAFAPCIRSTMIHYDPAVISQRELLVLLLDVDSSLPASMSEVEFPGRRIIFPIVLDDQWSREACQRYMSTTRNKAVYLPSNIDYLARNNGIPGGAFETLWKLISSNWLVFGVGFYLACPFLVPVDPRCRLVGQKMNPSRTFTPRGAVGIAGVVAAIYPTVSPGGYQLFGRTLPGWQTWGKGADFRSDRPWLLRPFDQIHFNPVSEKEYLEIEKEFDAGRYSFKIEPITFSMANYDRFTKLIAEEITQFKERQAKGSAQEEAREEELLREWQADKEAKEAESALSTEVGDVNHMGPKVQSSLSASIWKIKCSPGDVVKSPEDVLVILEAMKTEIAVRAGEENVGRTVRGMGKEIIEGAHVQPGDVLVLLD